MRRCTSLVPARYRRAAGGFTLIEVMIAVVVVAVLAAVAYPSFMSQIRKARRADAIEFAGRVQQTQERWRANNPAYAPNLTTLGIASATSGNGYYSLTSAAGANAAAATAYTVTAAAVSGKSQAADTGCTTMTMTFAAGVLAYTPAACWGR